MDIDLSADVTIVVGPNGTGKTSLLDALLWGITGRLKRISKEQERVLSLYAPAGLARVSITLEDERGRLTLVRTLLEGNETLGVKVEETAAEGPLAEVKLLRRMWEGGSASPTPFDDLHDIMTRSVYLQQDLVRQFVDRDTETQRFDAIGNLVGLGRIADFQRKIVASVKAWATAKNRLEEELRDAEARLTIAKETLARLGVEAEVSDDGERWSAWWRSLAEKGIGISPIPDINLPNAVQVVDQMLRSLQAAKTALQRKISTIPQVRSDLAELLDVREISEARIAELQGMVKTLRGLCDRLESEFGAAEKRDAEVREELVTQKNAADEMRALAQLALRHLSKHCPVCEQSIDQRALESRLRKFVDKAPAGIPEFQRETTRVTRELETARAAFRRAERDLSDALDENRRTAARRTLLNSQLADLEVEEPTLTALDALTKSFQTQLEDINEAYRAGEALSLVIVRRGERNKRQEIAAEEARLDLLVDRARSEFEQYKKTHEVASLIVEAVREVSDGAVNSQIKKIAPLLQKIYTRIDPHPTFRTAELRSHISYGKGRIETPVTDPRNAGGRIEVDSPATVFSSSQTNALAVSIFLAINLSSAGMPLNAAILDDPLQSLDDINLLGLLDALRRMRGRRQLLISTHDENFAALLERKFRPLEQGQKTSVVRLRNWERSGVSLEQSTEAQVPPRLQVVS